MGSERARSRRRARRGRRAGGVGGVSQLGQLFSGPAVPSTLKAAANVDVREARHPRLPHIPTRIVAATAPVAAAVRPTPVARARRPTRRTPTGGGPRTPTAHRSPGSARPVGVTAKPVTPPPPATTVTPPPPPPPAPRKTITRRVGDSLNRVVKPVPIVGPTAARAIDAVVTTVDKVLPLPPASQAVQGLVAGLKKG
jgi:hypothetical protein